MQMKTIFSFIILAHFSLFAFSQQGSKVAHVLKGKVINAESNQPVSYTNIGLEGTLYGTASDEEGNFELKIPEDLESKNIFFSAVGFQNRQFPLTELFGKEFNIVKLRPQSYDVGKIDVAGQNMVLIRILRMASENIRYNYGAGPFNLHCDLSVLQSREDSVLKDVNAKVLVYDKNGYSTPSPENAFRSRKYKVTKPAGKEDYTFSSAQLGIDELLNLDWVRSASGILNPALLNDYTLKLVSQPQIDGKEYWEIGFIQNKPTLEGSGDFYATLLDGSIFINKEDYSVKSIAVKVQSAQNNTQGRGLGISKSNADFYSNLNYVFIVSYENLLVKKIALSKQYIYNNKEVAENSVLTVNRAHANNVTVLNSRNYFAGE